MNILFIFRKADLRNNKNKYPHIVKPFIEKKFRKKTLLTYRHCMDKSLIRSFFDLDLFHLLFIIFTKLDQLLHILNISRSRYFRTRLYLYLYKSRNINKVITIMPNKSCNQAASLSKKNIQVFEIQHGVIGSHHNYYRYKNLEEQPSYFVIWSNYEKKIIENLNSNLNSNFIVFGIPTITKKIKISSRNKSNKIRILFPTQPSIINEFIPNLLIDELVKLQKLQNYKFEVCLRQHPSLSKELFNKKFKKIQKKHPYINWIDENSSLPILNSLLQTDLVITWHSSIVIEAVALQIPTIAISPDLLEDGIRRDSFYNERRTTFLNICTTKIDLNKKLNSFFRDKNK